MSTYSAYELYFEMIARKHAAILHTDTECHFLPMSPEEFLTGADQVTKAKYPLLHLEPYDYDYPSNEANPRKGINGAFIIWMKAGAKATTKKERLEKMDQAEQIGDQIISRMKRDKNLVEPSKEYTYPILNGFMLDSVRGEAFILYGRDLVGFRFEFKLFVHQNHNVDPAQWIS